VAGAILSPMSITSVVLAVQATAEAAEEHSEGEINPFIYGGTGLVVLLLLLFIVTRFNVNR
jgi:hypothetical protein